MIKRKNGLTVDLASPNVSNYKRKEKRVMLRSITLTAMLPFLFLSCLEEVSNVPRENLEATLIVIRNEGNSSDEVNVFIDSLLVAKTYQDKITEVLIPAGQHTLFFEYSHDYYGEKILIKPNSLIATRQYVLDAYNFTRVAFDSLPEDSLNKYLHDTLPTVKFKYYEATQKINTGEFNRRSGDFEDCKLELRTYDSKQ
jgi:hypothetical protein